MSHTPPALANWGEMDSDGQTHRWAFAGIAAHTLTPVLGTDADGAVYQSDFSWMKDLEGRSGFEPYGATAYFGADQRLIKIVHSHEGKTFYPADGAGWQRAKFVYRSSALVGVTLRDHLAGLHLTFADTVTKAALENLAKAHP